MNGFDVSLIPTIFLLFQVAVIGLFVLVHIFLGRKRGVTKTVWFFAGEIILVFVLLWGLGLFQTNDWVTEEMVRQYITLIPFGNEQLIEYMDEIVASGMLPLFLAIVDLSVKMSIFLVFYTILRTIFKWIVFGIPWLIFIKPIVKDKEKNKLLGGLFGIFRGAFAGFFLLFPVLITINTVVDKGVEIENPEYKDLVAAISDANQYNFVKYVNDVTTIEDTGLADYMFDLAFRSKVSDDETIIWRLELEWIAEAGKAAAPYFIDGEGDIEITLAEITKFEGAFSAFANSQLINSAVKPLMKFSMLIAAQQENFTFLTDEEINDLIEQIDAVDIDIANDFNEIYLAVTELLTIQDYASWEAATVDLSVIAEFDEDDKELFIDALNRLVSLDLLNLADPIISVFMYDQSIVDQISWLEDPNDRIELLNTVRQKINTHNGAFVSNTLSELVELFDTTFYSFPGIDLDGDSVVDVTLSEFIANLGDLSYVLNADPAYHVWFKDILDGIGNLSVIDVFMEPLIGITYSQLAGDDQLFDADELELIKSILDTNLSDQDDLKRELTWIAEVYHAIGNLDIGTMLKEGDEPVAIMDALLVNDDGQALFKELVDTFLDGTTISALTNQMSHALITRYVTEPVSLAEPLTRAAQIEDFNFKVEINVLLDVLFGLYDNDLTLSDAMSTEEGSNMIESLLPAIIEYVKDEEQKTKLLSSNIIYSFLDYNLGDIPMLETPDVIYETSGDYEGWIKRSEISNLLSVLDGLLTEMEIHNMSLSDLLGGMDSMNDFFPVIKGYAATPENRTTLLSSDIIYKTIDDLIQSIDLVEVPDTAKVITQSSPYYNWTERVELNKILEALVIMDLSIPEEGSSMNLDEITGEQINSVIAVESAIMTRLLTTYIKDANLFDIPAVAFEPTITNEQLDLKQSELQALGQLLVDLDLNMGDLIGSESSNLLNNYTVSQLTSLEYENSYLIKGFITHGITTGIGTPHHLALDTIHPEVLSTDEIEQLFLILNALDDADDSMTVQELMDTLNPELLTYEQTDKVITSGDSIVIRALITENLLDTQIMSDLSLQDAAFHIHNGNPTYDLISKEELQKLVSALSALSDPEDIVVNSVSELDPDEFTIADMIKMNGEDSSIIRTLMSDSLIGFVTQDKVATAAFDTNAPGDLTHTELTNFLNAIAVFDPTQELPLTDLVNTLSTTANDLTLSQMHDMHEESSLIMQKLMSDGIVTAVSSADVRDDAYSNMTFVGLSEKMIDSAEIDKVLLSLGKIADDEGLGDPSIADIVNDISTSLKIDVIREIALIESIIVYRKITKALDDGLTTIDMPTSALQVHPYAGNDITQDELINLTNAIQAFGKTTLDTDAFDSSSATLTNVKSALEKGSHIIDRLISLSVNDAGLSTIESHQGTEDPNVDIQKDELVNLVDAFIAFGISDIGSATTTSPAVIVAGAQNLDESEFNTFIDYAETNEYLGLTIVKDFLIDMLDGNVPDFDNGGFYVITNRQELHDAFF